MKTRFVVYLENKRTGKRSNISAWFDENKTREQIKQWLKVMTVRKNYKVLAVLEILERDYNQ
jgi:hypothetical protein